MKSYVMGVDYGTDSVRTIIVDAHTGKEVATAVHMYTRWAHGKYCNPAKNQFRQHPLDHIEGLELTVKEAVRKAGKTVAQNIKGLMVDTTGSTPAAVDKSGTVLSLKPEFKDNPNAMFILWKDHTAIAEAEEINDVARNWGGTDFTKYSGGIYSSEWFFSKVLHTLREDKKVRAAAFSWVENCDWIPALLTGDTNPLTLKRSRCTAGHKAMWHKSFAGLPSEKYLVKVDPLFRGLRDRLFKDTYTSDTIAGVVCKSWADRLGLPGGVVVSVGALDAHMGAVGAGVDDYVLTKVMGTSTCDMLVVPSKNLGNKLVKGICGQVDGSIIPGKIGLEAGQSAFGDIYAWYKNLVSFPLELLAKSGKVNKTILAECRKQILSELTRQAEKLPVGESGVVALDWLNGRRTPYANQLLKGAISGLTLGSDTATVYRALVESTAFGSKRILDRFKEEGIKIKKVIALGGIPQKSAFVVQVCADILNTKIEVSAAEQACALGSAMCAATAAGIYKKVEDAQKSMSAGVLKTYTPIPANVKAYAKLYQKYLAFGNYAEHNS